MLWRFDRYNILLPEKICSDPDFFYEKIMGSGMNSDSTQVETNPILNIFFSTRWYHQLELLWRPLQNKYLLEYLLKSHRGHLLATKVLMLRFYLEG